MLPLTLTLGGYRTTLPTDMLALLGVYRTKKDAQKEHGKDAVLVRVFIPKAVPRKGVE